MSICKLLTIFCAMLIVALLLLFGYCFMGRDDQSCPWVSSFIEVCVALDGALVVTRMREWLSAAFLRYARNLVQRGVDNPSGDFDEAYAEVFTLVLNRVLQRLDYRLSVLGRYARVCGPVFAVASVIVLLVGCEAKHYWLLTLLVSPFVVYYACAYVCYRCTADHLRELGYDVRLVGTRSGNDDDATIAGIQKRVNDLSKKTKPVKHAARERDKEDVATKRTAIEDGIKTVS